MVKVSAVFKEYVLPMLVVLPVFCAAAVLGVFWHAPIMRGLAVVLVFGINLARYRLPAYMSAWLAFTPSVYFAAAALCGVDIDMASFGIGVAMVVLLEGCVGVSVCAKIEWIIPLIVFNIAVTTMCGLPFCVENGQIPPDMNINITFLGTVITAVINIPQYIRWRKIGIEYCRQVAMAILGVSGKDCEED